MTVSWDERRAGLVDELADLERDRRRCADSSQVVHPGRRREYLTTCDRIAERLERQLAALDAAAAELGLDVAA